jgi:hypothetical protein
LPRAWSKDAGATTKLADYAGLYKIEGDSRFSIETCDQALCAQFPGQFPVPLHELEPDGFAASGLPLGFAFQRQEGLVVSAVVTRGGTHVLAQRLSERAPHLQRKAIAQSPDELRAYVGDYELDGDVLLRVSIQNGHLNLRRTGGTERSLFAFAKDRFADTQGCCELHFLHADSGQVDRMTIFLAGQDRVARRVQFREVKQ